MLVGAVGRDSFAAIALGSLGGEGVDTRLVQSLELPTGCAVIMVSPTGENTIAVAPGANEGVRCGWVPDEFLDAKTLLVAQLEVPRGETQALIRRVRRHGGRSVLNLAPALPIELELLSDIDFVVANEREAATLPPDPTQLARRLRQGLVVTRGAAGADAFLADGTRLHIPALAIHPVDTTGAGVFAAALDSGASIEAAMRQASAAAGLACLARGARRNARRSGNRRGGGEAAGRSGGRPAVFVKFGQYVDVELALERHDQLRKAHRRDPLPGVEFRVLGGEIDVAVQAGEAHDKPFLPLAAVAPAPNTAGKLVRQVVLQPASTFPDDLGLGGSDFFPQLTVRGLARALTRVDPALRHLPCRHPGHIDAAGDERLSFPIEQHHADRRTVAERLAASVVLLHRMPPGLGGVSSRRVR
jgi:ribokinase